MKYIKLTAKEKIELKILHKQVRKNVDEADRIKAIIMLSDGYTAKETAEVLLMDENTITRIKDKFLNRESREAWYRGNYTGFTGKLDELEKSVLIGYVKKEIITSCEKVVKFIKEVFGKIYSISGCQQLLRSLGFVYKYTKNIPSKADIEKQKEFQEFYEDLKEKMPEKEVLLFGDSVHPEHNTSPTRVWVKKGEEKFVKSNTGRERINISGLYEPEEVEITYVESETVNSEVFIGLLLKATEKYREKEKIHIVVDNSRVHYSKLVQEFLKENPKIELIFIPPYSPNLNLIERLWKFLRKERINTTYYDGFKCFRESVLEFLDNLSLYKKRVKQFVGNKLHIMPALTG